MKINELFNTGYEWLTRLVAEAIKELRKDKKEVLSVLDDGNKAIFDSVNKQTEKLNKSLYEVKTAIENKEVAKEVKVANPEQISGEIVDGLSQVIKTLKEEINKFDREIVVKNDLSSLLGLFKTNGDKKDLIKALSNIEKKIKTPEITDYTLILSDIASLVENINLPKLDKVEKLLAEMCAKDMSIEMPDHLEKYSEKGRIKVMLSDKQLKEIGGTAVISGSGNNQAVVDAIHNSSGFNIPEYDKIDLTYDGLDVSTVVYKKSGTTVATLTLGYTGLDLTSITKS